MITTFFSEEEIETIVRGLETCSTPKTDFPHRSHLTVAVWYLRDSSVDEALQKMRASLLRFLDHYQIDGKYNETITRFWLLIVERHLRELDPGLSLVERSNAVLEVLLNSRLLFEYYSPELLWSELAKREWAPPDLQSLA